MCLGCVTNGVFLPPFIIGHVGGILNKVRVIGMANGLETARLDISKDDCSSRGNV